MKSLLAAQSVGPDADWFASWFDSFHYHRLYAHRDAAEAAGFVDALIAHLKPSAAVSMVDLGCGSGRHARRLAAHGFNVTGLDLAPTTIDAAKRFESQALNADNPEEHGQHSGRGTCAAPLYPKRATPASQLHLRAAE